MRKNSGIVCYSELDQVVNASDFIDDTSIYHGDSKDIAFLPINVSDQTLPLGKERGKWNYTILIYGRFKNGQKATILIDGIKPYFEIEVEGDEEQFKHKILSELETNNTSPDNDKESRQIVYSKPLIGYTPPDEKIPYLKLSFSKQRTRKLALTYLRNNYKTYNNDYSNYFRVVSRNLKKSFSSWSLLRNYQIVHQNDLPGIDGLLFKNEVYRVTIDNYNNIPVQDILQDQHLSMDKTMIMTWDIECATKTGKLPNPEEKEDIMFMICATFHWKYSKEALLKICFVDFQAAASNNYVTVHCGDEKNVILGLAKTIAQMKPDIITGFNSSDFDWRWYVSRAYQHNVLTEVCNYMNEFIPLHKHELGKKSLKQFYRDERKKDKPDLSLSKYISTICYNYKYENIKVEADSYANGYALQFESLMSFDLRSIFRQEYSTSESSSLSYYLQMNKLGDKNDMPIYRLFEIYWTAASSPKLTEAQSQDLREIADYCIVDSLKCQELCIKRQVIDNRREIANLSYTTLFDAFAYAYGMKVRQIIAAMAYDRNFKYNSVGAKFKSKAKYPGAYVRAPTTGLVASKLSLRERVQKYNEHFDKYGDSGFNDLSYREIPYLKLNSLDNLDEKINCFELALASSDAKVVEASDDDVDTVLLKMYNLLLEKKIEMNEDDIEVFSSFMKETSGYPVGGLDFNSLYPSIIMAYNLSPETTLSLAAYDNNSTRLIKRYRKAEKTEEIKKVKFEYKGDTNEDVIGFFIRHQNKIKGPDSKFGIFPSTLKMLFDMRKQMKKPKEYFEMLQEHMNKEHSNTINRNKFIEKIKSYNLDNYSNYNLLIDEDEDLDIIKLTTFDIDWESKEDFIKLKNAVNGAQIEELNMTMTLEEACLVIKNRLDYDKHGNKIDDVSLDSISRVLNCGNLTYEQIDFYKNYYDSKQKAIKLIMNMFYGETGNQLSSVFLLAIAGSVTTLGQLNIKLIEKYLTELLCKIYYGDTDSLYISIPLHYFIELDRKYYSNQITKYEYWTELVNLTFKHIQTINKLVNDKLKETTGNEFLRMAYEELLYPVAFLSKKKYYGREHISVANFETGKLFVRGLEIKKRGTSDILKKICTEIMTETLKPSNLYEPLELIYNCFPQIYKRKWSYSDFAKSASYKPVTLEDQLEGKGNKTVLTFVERMKQRNIFVKPFERYKYVIIKKYPFDYDYRGRKVPLKVGDRVEFLEEAEKNEMPIDLDYYVVNTIIGQLARLSIYRPEFQVEAVDNSDDEIKKANDKMMHLAKTHLTDFVKKYTERYINKGPILQGAFREANKLLIQEFKNKGVDSEEAKLICRDWILDSHAKFYEDIISYCETKAKKIIDGYGLLRTQHMNKNEMINELRNIDNKIILEQRANTQLLAIKDDEIKKSFEMFHNFVLLHRSCLSKLQNIIYQSLGLDEKLNKPITDNKVPLVKYKDIEVNINIHDPTYKELYTNLFEEYNIIDIVQYLKNITNPVIESFKNLYKLEDFKNILIQKQNQSHSFVISNNERINLQTRLESALASKM
jgi:DNA polymerase elongation subunit (family B)